MGILKQVADALERLEQGQREVLRRLDAGGGQGPRPEGWLEQGIDQILAYEAGTRREVDR